MDVAEPRAEGPEGLDPFLGVVKQQVQAPPAFAASMSPYSAPPWCFLCLLATAAAASRRRRRIIRVREQCVSARALCSSKTLAHLSFVDRRRRGARLTAVSERLANRRSSAPRILIRGSRRAVISSGTKIYKVIFCRLTSR